MTLTKLTISIKKELKKKSGNEQTVWKEGDPELDLLVFAANDNDNDIHIKTFRAGRFEIHYVSIALGKESIIATIEVHKKMIIKTANNKREWMVLEKEQIVNISDVYHEESYCFNIEVSGYILKICKMNSRQSKKVHRLLTKFKNRK